MKQQIKFRLGFLLLAGFFLFSCKNNSEKTPAEPTNADTTSVAATTDSVRNANFVIVKKGEDAQSVPHSDIMLSVNGKQSLLKTIAGEASQIPTTEYERYQIPANAVDACGAYYAGGGDYFYVIMNNGTPEVYAGWEEEPQGDDQKPDTGYHWKKMDMK